MAKNSITDYSKTAASNTDIQSVDIDEGCLPSGINNAIREVMADLADVNDGTVALTSPSATALDVTNNITVGGTVDGRDVATDGTKLDGIEAAADVTDTTNVTAAGAAMLTGAAFTGNVSVTGDLTVDTDTLHVDSANNRVGIGTSLGANRLEVSGAVVAQGAATAYTNTGLYLQNKGSSVFDVGAWRSGASVGELSFSTDSGSDAAPVERMRIDSSGNVGIGTDSPNGKLDVSSGNDVDSGYVDLYIGGTSSSNARSGIIRKNTSSPYDMTIKASNYSSGNALIFDTGAGERMRIASGGQVSIGTTTSSHKLHTKETGNAIANRFQNSFATLTNAAPIAYITADRANSSAYYILETRSGGAADREHVLRGDGNAFADGVWQSGGADYAEYFEWTDGNASDEDRRGYSVVLVGNQIRKATSSDSVSDVIGVISGNPSVVGDTAWNKWDGKYNTDDFGAYIRETYTVTEWTEADGTEHSYASDEIPSGLVAPANATVLTTDADGATLTRRQLNASYDDSQTYTPREDRVEWDAVGLMGKLRLRVGQPTGSNWIKMRDTATDDDGNVTVEEWLVR